ncbi:alpha/beta fold hydrolase [Kitasatospora sp. NPDC002227]|uniref:alpha/beta fold hydrolase n=1 Tax=Kitasatospora sp. NPDC002227 TaxID=3154773 RepID=UPI00332157B7
MPTTAPLDHIAAGSGPGLVLIHGTGADASSNWGPLIDSLSDRYTVVAPNLPGAGATPTGPNPLDLGTLADQVLATANAVGLNRFHLAGHSIGATIATALAARHPESVNSLFLHAGWLRTGPREAFMFDSWAELLRTDPALLARQLILTAMGTDFLTALTEAQFADLAAGFTAMLNTRVLGQIDLDTRIDLRAEAPRVTAPTLVLSSTDDRIVPPHHQQALAIAIPHAEHHHTPGGHGLPFEDPTRFFSLITEYVDKCQAQTPAWKSSQVGG